jgi:hypothetical protein
MFPKSPSLPPGTPEVEVPRSNRSTHALVCELLDRTERLEGFFIRLLEALDEENEDPEGKALDGSPAGRERDQRQPRGVP